MLKKPTVKLIGENGNVFNLTAICVLGLRQEGYSEEQVQEFKDEVTSSKSYNEALNAMNEWCEVE